MASTAQRHLTETHRLAQLQLGAETVAHMRTIWPLLHPDNLDGTFDHWLSVALPIIRGQRLVSARLAAGYLATYKALTLGPAARTKPVLGDTLNEQALATSLVVTGPVSVKQAMTRGLLLDTALDVAMAASAAAAMRYVLDGGRDTVVQTVRADPQAIGYERVTSGNACPFCEGLAGEVFSADSVDFACHDGCSCAGVPVFA